MHVDFNLCQNKFYFMCFEFKFLSLTSQLVKIERPFISLVLPPIVPFKTIYPCSFENVASCSSCMMLRHIIICILRIMIVDVHACNILLKIMDFF